jgi:phenylacetate-CoA ligase
VDDAAGLTRRMEALGAAGVRGLFIDGLIGGLSLFNKAEANVESIDETEYQFGIRFVPRGSAEIHRTEVGKVPLLRDRY